ncbi:hypothetical protein GOEFS_082_00010 [Gordonia effusa NBRC 100432]|uniref:Uncharacterized protein n=1 Tax=Gordonia effusa NBRC 100432 TaxID=1077974 RepID=H0R2R6_9ACTN|nr:hypothetical protein [Gordonia effusa]GAB19367.1 hypothetical protein GOEFS_082_00010 [Gordonia effusa NBRC 100432]
MKVTAQAVRSGDWWAIQVPELPGLFTQARRLDQIATEVTDAASMLGVVVDEVDVQPVIHEDDQSALKEVRGQIAQLDRLQREVASRSRHVANSLRHQGFSLRDVGSLMGVSAQRISQLTGGRPSRKSSPAGTPIAQKVPSAARGVPANKVAAPRGRSVKKSAGTSRGTAAKTKGF